MMDWVITNWEWILLGFYTLEKIVRLSPTDKDDIIFDMIFVTNILNNKYYAAFKIC